MRADIQRQLEILKDVARCRSARSNGSTRSISGSPRGRSRLKKLSARREQLKKDLESLEINKVLLSHAGRIESLHDQSQWIIGLENQVAKLREEVAKLDADIEAAVTGYRSAGTRLARRVAARDGRRAQTAGSDDQGGERKARQGKARGG